MMRLEDIRNALGDRKVSRVADATGVNRQTIYTILKDPESNPTRKTLEALSDYFSKDAY